MKPAPSWLRTRAALVVTTLAVSLAMPASALAADRIIVGFRADLTPAQQAAELRQAGASSVDAADVAASDIPAIDVAAVTLPEGDGPGVRRRLLRDSSILFAEPDRRARASWTPNDPGVPQQWALSTIGATTAWDSTLGGGIRIAVLDTGVDYEHPDLRGRVDLGWDFVDRDADPMDVQGHGTHVAGISSANANDGGGIAGLAPQSRVFAVRVLDAEGSGYYSWIANGIVYAADRGARVINLSLGGNEASEAMRQAVEYAVTRGAVVTCASGNDGLGTVSYPAAYPGCFAVGATSSADQRASFSNYGANLDIVAPGQSILSSVMGYGWESWSGTSMATPYVSGLAALLAAQGLRRAQVEQVIRSTARDLGPVGYDTAHGFGRIDAAAAVAAAGQSPSTPYDASAPTVAGLSVGQLYLAEVQTARYVWQRISTGRWRFVRRTSSTATRSWQTVTTSGIYRRVRQYRQRNGVIHRRLIVLRKTRVVTTTRIPTRNVTIDAGDNLGIDRAGLAVNGRWIATDWNAADGWTIPWRCATGTHTFTAMAFDTSDNTGSRQLQQAITC